MEWGIWRFRSGATSPMRGHPNTASPRSLVLRKEDKGRSPRPSNCRTTVPGCQSTGRRDISLSGRYCSLIRPDSGGSCSIRAGRRLGNRLFANRRSWKHAPTRAPLSLPWNHGAEGRVNYRQRGHAKALRLRRRLLEPFGLRSPASARLLHQPQRLLDVLHAREGDPHGLGNLAAGLAGLHEFLHLGAGRVGDDSPLAALLPHAQQHSGADQEDSDN